MQQQGGSSEQQAAHRQRCREWALAARRAARGIVNMADVDGGVAEPIVIARPPCQHAEGYLLGGRSVRGHDCGYVAARAALVDEALVLAVRAAKLAIGWSHPSPGVAIHDHRAEIVEEKFYAAMDWLAKVRGIAGSTRAFYGSDRAVFETLAPETPRLVPAPIELRVLLGGAA